MSEAQTRKEIIDKRLKTAGWDVEDPVSVTTEHPVLHQPGSSTGTGYSDYVLLGRDGSTPLAVVEAKKTSSDVAIAREQAEQYAAGVEKMGHPRPFIFYTNGYEIYFWDDLEYPPRKVYGFFTRDDLERLQFQRKEKRELSTALVDTRIVERPYQIEAIRRVLEAFTRKRRKALLVMATGTGKTRTAMALIDVMMRANWVKRVLFLADRNALLRQARDAFKEFLPNAPWTRIFDGKCPPDKRVYLATYPSMHGVYPTISPGFFDLIIADESHRSIYKRYKEIFDHFDAFQVGLTATPVDYIERNTFKMFECEDGNPTFNFSYEEAINHKPPYLVPFKALSIRSRFQMEGIKAGQLPLPIQKKLVEEGKDLDEIDFEGTDLEKKVTNSGTNELIVREFMEQSIKNETGTRPGKSIVFAISHKHAVRLEGIFDRLYPEYKGRLARVIDSHDPRANTEGGLLDQFKTPNDPLKVAISVDMLDTGVDIPEVVNLVFAKPVFSRTKFWQMIGRGTRLCRNLFGPNEDKSYFLIIDHWNNFSYFNMKPEGKDPSATRSIPEQLFEARLQLAQAALSSNAEKVLPHAVTLLRQDIAALPKGSVIVKDGMAHVDQVREEGYWAGLSSRALDELRKNIQPLMRARSNEDFNALLFDLAVTRAQIALARNDADAIAEAREEILADVNALPLSLNQVRAKEETIRQVKGNPFWKTPDQEKLESVRLSLRGVMKHREKRGDQIEKLDLDDITLVKEVVEFGPELERASVAEYRRQVEEKIQSLLRQNESLRKLKAGEELDAYDISALADQLRSEDPYVTEELLRRIYDNRTAKFIDFIKHILGLQKLQTRTDLFTRKFDEFIARHNTFTANQIQFLQILLTFVLDRGKVEKADLVSPPFTNIHPKGIRGLFRASEVDEIVQFAQEIGEKAA